MAGPARSGRAILGWVEQCSMVSGKMQLTIRRVAAFRDRLLRDLNNLFQNPNSSVDWQAVQWDLNQLRHELGFGDPPGASAQAAPECNASFPGNILTPRRRRLAADRRRSSCSADPNDVTGPSGIGPAGFISSEATLPYTIDFENLPTATAPAQTVTVTQELSPNLDWSTFQLGAIDFGSTVVNVPAGTTSYTTTIGATATLGLFVDVTAGINLSTGLVTWTFTSIDPTTLDLTSNPLAGFLPPDVTPPEGEGSVSYTIKPKANLASGTVVERPGHGRLRHQCPHQHANPRQYDRHHAPDQLRESAALNHHQHELHRLVVGL